MKVEEHILAAAVRRGLESAPERRTRRQMSVSFGGSMYSVENPKIAAAVVRRTRGIGYDSRDLNRDSPDDF